jgi:shikimate dehydrogenase
MQIDTSTQLCAVIGNPVAHSLSPHLHNAAYQAAGLNFVYMAFQVSDVKACLDGMRSLPNFRGLSVTIPHKVAVMDHLDEIDAMAAHVGSVNTITNEDGRLIGSTTDGPGTLRAFDEAGVSLDNKRVLFLGTGGAVRAVAFAVAEQSGADSVTILGRTQGNVEALVRDLSEGTDGSKTGGSLESDLQEAVASHDVIIQGTPVGMAPDDSSLVPAALLRSDQVVFDMVYRPMKTRLLREAEAAGCTTVLGIEMLINQAALQFERWTGAACPTEAMRSAALSALGES